MTSKLWQDVLPIDEPVNTLPKDCRRASVKGKVNTSCARVPGVSITAAQGSEDTQISIRGSGNLENDTIAGTEMVVDGIYNQGDGEAYLQDLDLNSVKFAESLPRSGRLPIRRQNSWRLN